HELPFARGARTVGEVARRILERERYLEKVLHCSCPSRQPRHTLARVGKREQIVQMGSARAAEAEVVAHPCRSNAPHQSSKPLEVRPVRFIRAADRKRYAVQYDGLLLANSVQVIERATARS